MAIKDTRRRKATPKRARSPEPNFVGRGSADSLLTDGPIKGCVRDRLEVSTSLAGINLPPLLHILRCGELAGLSKNRRPLVSISSSHLLPKGIRFQPMAETRYLRVLF